MEKLLFFLWISLTLIACQPSGNRDEQAIRTMCLEMVERYPEATLQDVYKSCFQDFFGAEHLLKDTAAALAYLQMELANCGNEDLSALPAYEPTGFRHRFVQVNLSQVLSGQMSADTLFARFISAAGSNNAFSDNWASEWEQIERIALETHPSWADSTLQAELHMAASLPCAVRHSEPFRNAYHPHYRIIINP